MADSEPAVYTAPVVPRLVASAARGIRPNAKLIALLSLGHFVVDLNQGSLPALLPFLKTAHQLSYAAVATIVLAANVAEAGPAERALDASRGWVAKDAASADLVSAVERLLTAPAETPAGALALFGIGVLVLGLAGLLLYLIWTAIA